MVRLMNACLPVLSVGILLSLSGIEAVAEPVEYELMAVSRIVDGCRDCDRIPIVRKLEDFLLEYDPGVVGVERYLLTEIAIRSPEGEYQIQGEGTYGLVVVPDQPNSLELALTVNGTSGVALSTEAVPQRLSFPAFDVEVTEPGDRDPVHLYTIRLAAAPKVKPVAYELVEGSTFYEDCKPCMRPIVPIPIRGTFLLGELPGGANPIISYRVDEILFESVDSEAAVKLAGSGLYRQGGEVALIQGMVLDIALGFEDPRRLECKDPSLSVVFPALDVALEEPKPATEFSVHNLHIVAKPVGVSVPEFKRGDTNADGFVDISDAVSLLLFLFGGETAPVCMEAADADGDGDRNLTDAIYSLMYLFQGGEAPPAPGPKECGPSPSVAVDCASYPSCAGM